MMDVDLEKGNGIPLLHVAEAVEPVPPTPKSPRRGSRRGSMMGDMPTGQKVGDTVMEKLEDEENLVLASCGCDNANTFELLPFIQPRELGLDRPSRGSS